MPPKWHQEEVRGKCHQMECKRDDIIDKLGDGDVVVRSPKHQLLLK